MTERALKVGDRIKDNDPRTTNRVLALAEVPTGDPKQRLLCMNIFRPTQVRRDRIYTDGKPRKSGFSLVTEAP